MSGKESKQLAGHDDYVRGVVFSGDGRVVLYRSTERGLQTQIDPRYARTEDSLGWDVYCHDLEIVHVPGNHTSMIDRPQVDPMARHLSNALLEEVRHA